MDNIKITHIGRDCYESYPCQHKCQCIISGIRAETLINATNLCDHPELMDNELLLHFSEYRPDLKNLIKSMPPKFWLISEFTQLYNEKYLKRRDIAFSACLEAIEQLDIEERMRQCLTDGYAGFIVYEDPFYGTFSKEQKTQLNSVLDKKTREFDRLIIVSRARSSLVIYINSSNLGLTHGEDIIVHKGA